MYGDPVKPATDWYALAHEVPTGEKPEKGDVWYCSNTRISVKEIDPDGKWAMIHCSVPMTSYGLPDENVEWDKQQPLSDRRFPNSWRISQRGGRNVQRRLRIRKQRGEHQPW